MPKLQSPGNSLAIAEAGVSESVAEITVVSGGREDLTVFFAIGLVLDVFLVAAFLVWAVGQWHKTKK